MQWWYRQKYNLAETDPRYLDSTADQMLEAYYADLLEKNPNVEFDETMDFDEELITMERRAGVDGWEDV